MGVLLDDGPSPPTHACTDEQTHTHTHRPNTHGETHFRVSPSALTDHMVAWQPTQGSSL